MNTPFISVIIVSWNALHYLKEFLPSVCATTYKNVEIILADNASTDESVTYTQEYFPTVRICQLDKNYGYCGGNNRGAKFAKGEILLFLNNDVKVNPNWLEPIAACFSDDRTAVVQPKLLSLKQPDFFEYAGAAGGEMDYLGYPFCRGRIFDTLEKDEGQYEKNESIFWASGAAFAIRKNIFEQFGGFDEDFEFHMEEIDLCWRILRKGYAINYEPKSVVWHLGGGSLNSLSPRKTYYNFRNNWWMMQKNLNSAEFASVILPRLLLDVTAGFKELLSGRFGHFSAVFRGVFEALKNPKKYIPGSLKDSSSVLYPKSIVVDYFVKGKNKFGGLG
jgi:GT2 family glycosyltransferase